MSAGAAVVTGDADLAAGHKVGEYVIDEKIGQGGFGAVFRATHPLIGKLAAVKVLSRTYSADPEVVSRFVAEARAVNQIRHRHIIDIFSFGELEDGRSYYVMEFLDGEPLDVRLESGPMNVEEAVPVLRAIGRALDAAHAAGIAHRDLKPANIFLVHEADGDLFPKLLDFGIAKLLGEATSLHKTRTGTPIGTPFYMSPEQCRGQGLDHRTDIYSFGCVAYEMLTGRVPFDGDNHLEILMKQIGEEPEPPSQRNPDVPPAIDDVIAWMMKKDPAERPPTLSAAIAALEQAAGIPPSRASHPVMTPPPGVATSRTPAHGVPLQRASSQDGRRASSQGDKRVSSRGPGALADTMTAAPPRRRWWIPAAIAVVALGGAGAFVMTRGDSEPARTPPAAPPPVATTPAPEKPAPAPPPVAEPAPVAAPPVEPPPPPVQTKADTKPKVVAKPRPKAKPAATQPAAPPPPGAPPADPYTRE